MPSPFHVSLPLFLLLLLNMSTFSFNVPSMFFLLLLPLFLFLPPQFRFLLHSPFLSHPSFLPFNTRPFSLKSNFSLSAHQRRCSSLISTFCTQYAESILDTSAICFACLEDKVHTITIVHHLGSKFSHVQSRLQCSVQNFV